MAEPIANAKLQALIERVVQEFQRTATQTTADPLRMEEMALITHLRETFIMGGIARLEEVYAAEHWLQVGLRFASQEQHRDFMAHTHVAERCRAWLAEDRIRHVFFVNKAPGIRLRFCCSRLDAAFREELVEFLRASERQGVIAGFEFGVYDPETHQFGGEPGMPGFHQFSTGDSLAILDLHALWARRPDGLDSMIFSLAVLADLARKVSGDSWEQWDLWCNLRLAHRGVEAEGALLQSAQHALAANRTLLSTVAFRPDDVVAELAADERVIVESCFHNNTAVADSLARAARSGELRHGIRKIVPFYFIFHWNRLYFSSAKQMTLTLLMKMLLDPKNR